VRVGIGTLRREQRLQRRLQFGLRIRGAIARQKELGRVDLASAVLADMQQPQPLRVAGQRLQRFSRRQRRDLCLRADAEEQGARAEEATKTVRHVGTRQTPHAKKKRAFTARERSLVREPAHARDSPFTNLSSPGRPTAEPG